MLLINLDLLYHCLVCVSSKANPEGKICMEVVYLEDDLWRHSEV